MPSARSLIDDFRTERSLRVSKTTVNGDSSYLARFVDFLESQGVTEVCEVAESHLADYSLFLRGRISRWGRPLSTSFISRSLSVTKMFLIWARERGFMQLDFSSFPVTRPLRKLVDVPSVEQVRRLLEAPTLDTPEGLRDSLIYEFFYTLGLRAKECLRLDLEHIDTAGGIVKVTGKGSHERLLPMSPRLLKLVALYLRQGRPGLRPQFNEVAFWIAAQTGRRLGYTTMKQRLSFFGDLQGLKVHPHLLRHACATHLLEAGAGIESIGTLLGHRRIESTSHYAQISAQELALEHERCHPRAGL